MTADWRCTRLWRRERSDAERDELMEAGFRKIGGESDRHDKARLMSNGKLVLLSLVPRPALHFRLRGPGMLPQVCDAERW